MLLIALLLGIVEGITEFLPISSTGHLILATSLTGLTGRRAEVFGIFIQLGAVLAVVWEYRDRLTRLIADLPRRAEARIFASVLLIAFLPAAILGLLAHRAISEHLFRPATVAAALIVGAILIFVVESLPPRIRTVSAEHVTLPQALSIGLAQCLSLWPGFSRSAATILGGLTVGLDRRTATEFSFFLAIPTLGAATLYDLAKNLDALEPGDSVWLLLGLVVSFLVAWASIRWLLRFVSTHDLRPFAWYRIALGIVVLLLAR
jgi:undecaprenyl-diphosphatase